MRTLSLAVTVFVIVLFGRASSVHATDATCVGLLNGIVDGNVVVPRDASCTMSDVTVTGNVQISENASLTIDATEQPATIGGDVDADNCVFTLLKGGVMVGGNVQVKRCSSQSGFVGPGIKISGNFECHQNLGGCKVDLGDVRGNVRIESNHSNSPSDISLVAVRGNLQCQQNIPALTHTFGPNWVSGKLEGQCSGSLGFAAKAAAPKCANSTFNVPNLTVASAVDVAATVTMPEYCRAMGVVTTNGEGYGQGSAQLRLKLPVRWNGRFLFEGCGGNCGSVTATSVNPVDDAEALGLGYAVVNTDTGHEQDPTTPDPTWILLAPGAPNTPAIIDFYYRAVHQVTVAAKQYVEAYYGQPIEYAYFDGCSTGGRQSLMEGTHYPVDYDGLIAGAPVMSLSYQRTSGFKQAKAFLSPLAWIPFSKVEQIDAAVKASCDALDGVTDGLIQNPAKCSFNPSSLLTEGILSASQMAGLQSYIKLETDPTGAPVYPGMPISDLSTSGFEGIDDSRIPAFNPTAAQPWGGIDKGPAAWTLTDAGIRYFVKYDPSFDVNNNWPETVSASGNVVPDKTLALLRRRVSAADSEDPLKLKNFLRRGGKAILYHGGSDPLITPFRSIWYYEQLASLHGGYGATQDSVRLFIVPGMGHCEGGVAPNSFDTLKALDNWVTKDVGPEAIVATVTDVALGRVKTWVGELTGGRGGVSLERRISELVSFLRRWAGYFGLSQSHGSPSFDGWRTMPLCKFPEEASYSGSGNVNLAENWSCNGQDARMLQVGTNGAEAGATRGTALQYLYDSVGLGGR
jgi:feruloyl esterase